MGWFRAVRARARVLARTPRTHTSVPPILQESFNQRTQVYYLIMYELLCYLSNVRKTELVHVWACAETSREQRVGYIFPSPPLYQHVLSQQQLVTWYEKFFVYCTARGTVQSTSTYVKGVVDKVASFTQWPLFEGAWAVWSRARLDCRAATPLTHRHSPRRLRAREPLQDARGHQQVAEQAR